MDGWRDASRLGLAWLRLAWWAGQKDWVDRGRIGSLELCVMNTSDIGLL